MPNSTLHDKILAEAAAGVRVRYTHREPVAETYRASRDLPDPERVPEHQRRAAYDLVRAAARPVRRHDAPAIPESILADIPRLSIAELAALIRRDWSPPAIAAEGYIEAMSELDTVADTYGPARERGDDIVRYFLSNCAQWRGPVARRIKAELRKRVGI